MREEKRHQLMQNLFGDQSEEEEEEVDSEHESNPQPDSWWVLSFSLLPFTGDVGDPATLYAAVQGCNKIIYCATALSTVSGDLYRVDEEGSTILLKRFWTITTKWRNYEQERVARANLQL